MSGLDPNQSMLYFATWNRHGVCGFESDGKCYHITGMDAGYPVTDQSKFVDLFDSDDAWSAAVFPQDGCRRPC